jgi:enoyl-CoA hydratase/carnithine racemase
MLKELLNLLTEIERDKRVDVVLFDNADPDFFLAHYDIAGDTSELDRRPWRLPETRGGSGNGHGTP